ncbi:MAG: hypothetical protein HYW65_03360 [Candidatus Liptonbacteria bacterium]|nr:hypothetical protein [Candidatus Liptonbacteria bacterium]
MSKRFAVIVIVIVIVLVLAGVWVGSLIAGGKRGASGYTAVFLVTGDVYFGKLSWFPSPKLSSAWFLQRGVDQQNQPQLGLAPFTSVFWGPAGDVYLNPKQILFWAPIKPESQVAQAIANPQSVQQAAPPAGGQSQQVLPPQPPSEEKKK